MKKIIEKILAVAALVSAIHFGMGGVSIEFFIDFSGMLFIIIVASAMLILFNEGKDYLNGYKTLFGKGNLTIKDLECSENAFSVAIKLVYLSAFINVIFNFIILSTRLDDPSIIGPSINMSILTMLYAVVINVVQNGIKSRIEKEIIMKK